MPVDDAQFRMRRQEAALANIQAKMAGQTKFNNLRDDPLSATHAVRYESYLARLERFEKNTLYAKEHLNQTDAYLRQANDVLQRLRVIAVTGANGIYTPDDMRAMGVEVNELLKELATIANATGPDGTRLFAGDKSFTEPFRITEGKVGGGWEAVAVSAEYQGAGASRRTETSDGRYIDLDMSGGEAFWAENMTIRANFDATNYEVTAEGSFFVDGVEIEVSPGDNLAAITAKINDSPAPVRASIDSETNALVIMGMNPHLIRMEDTRGSTVLQDLGVIIPNAEVGAPNWNPSARVSGGSVFDVVMDLRDALYQGDASAIGGRGIGSLDLALNNVQTRLVDIGSRVERADFAWKRLNAQIPDVTEALGRESSLDFTTAAVDLGMMDFAHKATLQTAAKILPQSLLNFLR
jgi:flagellar hook-associated protein 3 FlgL